MRTCNVRSGLKQVPVLVSIAFRLQVRCGPGREQGGIQISHASRLNRLSASGPMRTEKIEVRDLLKGLNRLSASGPMRTHRVLRKALIAGHLSLNRLSASGPMRTECDEVGEWCASA